MEALEIKTQRSREYFLFFMLVFKKKKILGQRIDSGVPNRPELATYHLKSATRERSVVEKGKKFIMVLPYLEEKEG
jgi:hypothetical protein